MEGARPAYYNGDDLDLKSCFSVVSHYGPFEWSMYVVNVGNGVQCDTLYGVLTLYEL